MKAPTRRDLGNVLWASSGLLFMLFIFLLGDLGVRISGPSFTPPWWLIWVFRVVWWLGFVGLSMSVARLLVVWERLPTRDFPLIIDVEKHDSDLVVKE
jgi:hypothetical protein